MFRSAMRAFAMLVLVAVSASAAIQPVADDAAIRRLVAEFETAWNSHDMGLLGQILTDDIDFVNVAGLHWKGRAQVVDEHAARHKVRFRNSVWKTEATLVQFVRPDVALVYVDWSTSGDLDFDLKPWAPRKGTFLWVAIKDRGVWRVRAVQNTDRS